MSDFDTFWAAYPRKVAKREAMKAWGQLKPDAELVEHILAALFWQVRQPGMQMKYFPYPATWIRGERWTDEPPEGQRVNADIYGHVPPCQSWADCTRKALADAKA